MGWGQTPPSLTRAMGTKGWLKTLLAPNLVNKTSFLTIFGPICRGFCPLPGGFGTNLNGPMLTKLGTNKVYHQNPPLGPDLGIDPPLQD